MRGAIERFLRIVAAAMLVAIGVVLTHVATPEQALAAFEFTVGSAILVAADKLRRAIGDVPPAADPSANQTSTPLRL